MKNILDKCGDDIETIDIQPDGTWNETITSEVYTKNEENVGTADIFSADENQTANNDISVSQHISQNNCEIIVISSG